VQVGIKGEHNKYHLSMLSFCTWKDEDGRHYGVTNKNPKAYFNWSGCHLCDPKSCNVTATQCDEMIESPAMSVVEALRLSFIEVEIKDWDIYFDDVRPRLKSVY